MQGIVLDGTYNGLARAFWARSLHSQMDSFEQAGEGKDREHGPKTINKYMCIQSL